MPLVDCVRWTGGMADGRRHGEKITICGTWWNQVILAMGQVSPDRDFRQNLQIFRTNVSGQKIKVDGGIMGRLAQAHIKKAKTHLQSGTLTSIACRPWEPGLKWKTTLYQCGITLEGRCPTGRVDLLTKDGKDFRGSTSGQKDPVQVLPGNRTGSCTTHNGGHQIEDDRWNGKTFSLKDTGYSEKMSPADGDTS